MASKRHASGGLETKYTTDHMQKNAKLVMSQ